MRYTTYKTRDSLVKAIAQCGAHYATARSTTQSAAIGILKHAAQHGDYSLANSLVEAVGTGDAVPLVKWLQEFGGLTVSEDSKSFDGWSGKQHIIDKLESAKDTMFWTYKEKSPYKGFDLEEALAGLISKAGKATKKAADDDSVRELVHVDSSVLQALVAIKAGMSTAVH